ncbi:MAG: amino acid carrier protein [Bacteroidales bacterium]|nr:amino acid carrier protein [Bacteroidales bacterium]MBN2758150.1 amino acid carrier protein [Bacteroidales bacterium]
MIKLSFSILLVFSSIILNAQNLTDSITQKEKIAKTKKNNLNIDIKLSNLTLEIQDGFAKVIVKNGKKPYTYKWSNRNTDLKSNTSSSLAEGSEYQVTVTDSDNNSITKSFTVPAESADEKINAFFAPIVNIMSKIVLADIFAELNLYDPTIHDDNGNIIHFPNGDPRAMSIPFVVVWLVIGAIFFTVKMGFVNFRGFKHSIQLIKGKYDNPNDKGEVSHFQALATALSATVGLGNIAGVAIAITVGGPGATFWMVIAGLLGMSSKFTEVTLGVKYRNIDKEGVVSGGPMFYLEKGLKKRNLGVLGKVLAVIFAILVIGGSLGGGNMFQSNQAFAQLSSNIPLIKPYGAYFGIILAFLVGIVIIGGIKSIAKVTEKIVPFMAILYVGTALVIIIMNIHRTHEAFLLIFNGAFAPDAIKGGIIGVLIIGFQRASFSNEAGVGSASIAHSAVKTDEPISEGIVALLEPFIDTVVICTMTALVIIFTGFYEADMAAGLNGAELTSKAFESVFSWFPYLLTFAIFLFAFSTMISWSYYGLNGFKFLFGRFIKNKKTIANIYFAIFLIFIIIGSSSSLGAVLDFSDMAILSMAFPNILGLLILSGEVRKDMKSYFKRIKSGEIIKFK